jgi:ClpP class serine protease
MLCDASTKTEMVESGENSRSNRNTGSRKESKTEIIRSILRETRENFCQFVNEKRE